RITDLEQPVDVACIAAPAGAVPGVVEDCIAAGVPAGIIYSAGFAGIGEAGKKAEDGLRETARGRFRFLGANTLGDVRPSKGLCASSSRGLEADYIPAGSVGFVSQSGAIASSLLGRIADFGLNFSHWISCGNEAGLDLSDHLAFLVDDPDTRVICMFL